MFGVGFRNCGSISSKNEWRIILVEILGPYILGEEKNEILGPISFKAMVEV